MYFIKLVLSFIIIAIFSILLAIIIRIVSSKLFGFLHSDKLQKLERSSHGVTKTVKLTLPESAWEYIDKKAAGNRSEFIRKLLDHDIESQGEWSDKACLGYAILTANELGYSEEQTEQLLLQFYRTLNLKTINEAKAAYESSRY